MRRHHPSNDGLLRERAIAIKSQLRRAYSSREFIRGRERSANFAKADCSTDFPGATFLLASFQKEQKFLDRSHDRQRGDILAESSKLASNHERLSSLAAFRISRTEQER
jgi:hypothetical protein